MDIHKEKIKYKDNLPYDIKICNVKHGKPHFHKTDIELILCLEGYVDIIEGSESERINAGEVYSVFHGYMHYLYSDEDNSVLILHLDQTNLDKPLDAISDIYIACESNSSTPRQNEVLEDVKDIMLTLAYKHCLGLKGSPALANTLAEMLLEYFDWYAYENPSDRANKEERDRFRRIISYCIRNYTDKISISEIAEKEHLNKNYVSQFFSRIKNLSLVSYINYFRCVKAEILMLTTDMSMLDISYECGFSNPNYLYNTFEKFYHCTPKKHKAKYAEYLKSPICCEQTEDTHALELLQNAIIDRHIERTMGL